LGVVQERGGEHRACCAASTIPSSNDPHVSRVPKHFCCLAPPTLPAGRRSPQSYSRTKRFAALRVSARLAVPVLPPGRAVRDNKDVPRVPGTGAPPARRGRAAGACHSAYLLPLGCTTVEFFQLCILACLAFIEWNLQCGACCAGLRPYRQYGCDSFIYSRILECLHALPSLSDSERVTLDRPKPAYGQLPSRRTA